MVTPTAPKSFGKVLLKALWRGAQEFSQVRAGIAVVQTIRQDWFREGQDAAANAEAISKLTPQEIEEVLGELKREFPQTPEKAAELEATLGDLPRTFRAGSRVLSSVADFTRIIPNQPLKFNPREKTADGQYELKQFLGSGNFGEVWRATHLDRNEEHALKFCTDEISARILLREQGVLRGLLGQLKTPHVVKLEGSNFATNPPYLAFSFCPGGDLVNWIEQKCKLGKAIPKEKALQLFEQMAQGVAAAHALNFVHRDIKPGNVLIDAQERAVISDFGLGRLGVENNLDLLNQLAGGLSSVGLGVMGTPLYMAPEILARKVAKEDLAGLKKGDVYALGVTGFQLFMGDVELGPINVRRQLTVKGIPEAVISLIEDCVSPAVERPADAGVVYQRLAKVNRKGFPIWTLAVGILALGLIGFVAVNMSSNNSTPSDQTTTLEVPKETKPDSSTPSDQTTTLEVPKEINPDSSTPSDQTTTLEVPKEINPDSSTPSDQTTTLEVPKETNPDSSTPSEQATTPKAQQKTIPGSKPELKTASEYFDSAKKRYESGDKLGAIEDYTQAIKLKPDYASAYNNRGAACSDLGDKQGAIEDYQTAKKLYFEQGNTKDYQDTLDRLKGLGVDGG